MKRNQGHDELGVGQLVDGQGQNAYDVIVIGSGIGGLTAAALLARRGFKVLVLERDRQPGGNCVSWRRRIPIDGGKGTFVFDCGVQDISGLGAKGPLNSLLQQLDATDRIAWKRVEHLYWKNGVCIAGGDSTDTYIASLCRQFPDDAADIHAFFTEIRAVYRELYADVDTTGGIPTPPSATDLQAWSQTHPHAARWLKRPFEEMLHAYLRNPAIHAQLLIISEYITDTPQQPLVQEMAPLFGYYFSGGYYPSGGSARLPQTLANVIEEHHGTISFRTTVSSIIVEHGRARGVRTSCGERLLAPIVIANGDVVATLTDLIDSAHLPSRYASRLGRMRRGPSAIVVNVALSTIMPLPARIFIQNNGRCFGVGNPSVLDNSLAPDQHSAVTLLLLLTDAEAEGWLDKSTADYGTRKDAIADELFSAIESSVFSEFRKHILYKEVATPASFMAYTGAGNGNIYGAACASWRPRTQSPIPGLLLVGGGTETGPGIEAVIISGTRAANLVCERQSDFAQEQ